MTSLASDRAPSSAHPAEPIERLRRLEVQQHRATQTPPAIGASDSPHARPADDIVQGPTLGRELPVGVYLAIVGAYAWILLVAWFAFDRGTEAGLNLGIVSVILVLLLGLPAIIFHLAWTRLNATSPDTRNAYWADLDTATGALPPREAWVQILIIPGALAIAAALIGAVYLIVV